MMNSYDVNYETIASGSYALLVLNESLDCKKSNSPILKRLWRNAKKRVLVDGGSNWLFANYSKFGDPDYICGDLDSISTEVLEFFKQKLTLSKIIRLPDQDETDFDKTVTFCIEKFKNDSIDYLAVIWAQTNRIDHNLSCISTLIKQNNRHSLPIYMIDLDSSLSCVLNGKKKIKINPQSKWCSIIPIGEPVKVSTTGFKWNITDFELKFGVFVSSSNEFDQSKEFCTIQCERPIYFLMHFPDEIERDEQNRII